MKLERKKIVPELKKQTYQYLKHQDGVVLTINDFFKKNNLILQKHERLIIKNELSLFEQKIPNFLENPLILTENSENESVIKIVKIGSRSTFWPEKKIKIKGCRWNGMLSFPHERLDFGSTIMKTEEIPFGILTKENVLREILAYCFLKKYNIRAFQKPMVVFEYHENKKVIGYALVYHSLSEKRIESRENYFNLTVKDFISIKFIEKTYNVNILPNESNIIGIKEDWYAKEKSKLLLMMNFNGGFRGFLNSNLGNDIVYKRKFYICDFDTFKVIKIPKKASENFIFSFCLWSMIELIKSSPLVFDYIDLSGIEYKEAAGILWKSYSEKSLLWAEYKKGFVQMAKKLKWSNIEDIMQRVTEQKIFYELILDNVLNSKILIETYDPNLSFYTPQGN